MAKLFAPSSAKYIQVPAGTILFNSLSVPASTIIAALYILFSCSLVNLINLIQFN